MTVKEAKFHAPKHYRQNRVRWGCWAKGYADAQNKIDKCPYDFERYVYYWQCGRTQFFDEQYASAVIRLYGSLPTRPRNCCHRFLIDKYGQDVNNWELEKLKEHILKHCQTGEIHPKQTRNLGWKAYMMICEWVGVTPIKLTRKFKMIVCPHCGKEHPVTL